MEQASQDRPRVRIDVDGKNAFDPVQGTDKTTVSGQSTNTLVNFFALNLAYVF